jgi:hypothetical protein
MVRSFTISKAPLTVTAQDKTMTLGATPPVYTATYAGLVAADTPAVVTGLTCASPATSTSPVGSYAITCSAGRADNYIIAYRPGVLTVTYAFGGFIGLSTTSVNIVKAGANVSLQWSLKDASGTFVSAKSSFVSLTLSPMTCGSAAPTTGTSIGAGPADLKYDTRTGIFTYNWKTSKASSGCAALTLHVASGATYTALIQYKG